MDKLLAIVLIIVVVVAVVFVMGQIFATDIATTALVNILDCHYTGLMDIRLGSESSAKEQHAMEEAYPNDVTRITVKYWSLLSDELIVPETGYGDLYARTEDFEYCIDSADGGRTCIPDYYGNPEKGFVSVLVAGYLWKPTDAGQIDDVKAYFNLAYITGVSNTLHPLGAYVANPGFNPQYKPENLSWDFWSSAACWLTIIKDGNRSERNCADFGYMPDSQIELKGPAIIDHSGLFLVEACAQDITVTSFTDINSSKMPPNFPNSTKETLQSLFNIALP